MSLNIKYWRSIFPPKLKTLIYELIFVKNNVYPATIKNDNGAVEIRIFLCDAKESNNSIDFKKDKIE